MQEWILRLRKRGLAVLLVHHSGKSGEQRGTSRREDVLDTVIGLRRPEDYEPQQGARFEVHVEKSRAHFGDAGRPFEANLVSMANGGGLSWLACDLKPSHFEEAAALFRGGATVRAAAAARPNPPPSRRRFATSICLFGRKRIDAPAPCCTSFSFPSRRQISARCRPGSF
jgi:hypothetical protein